MYIYSTLSNKLEKIDEKNISIYVCGVTPYAECHLGHAMSAMVYDTLIRFLKWKGHNVKYVSNYTDIDDKIIEAAKKSTSDPIEMAKKNIDLWETQQEQLGLNMPDIRPKVTDEIDTIINSIKKIIDSEHAYVTQEGAVYYRVQKNKNYGKLSKRKLKDLLQEDDSNEDKESPIDFALWKPKKHGEPGWQSPWGEGRPGWHIECSAMAEKYLGENFTIHGGGTDLIFPHHENEIAQAFGAGSKGFAKIWMHNGMLLVEGKKMSKSVGNYISVEEALNKWSPAALRFFILSAGYRQPTNFSNEAMNNATNSVQKIEQIIRDNQNTFNNFKNDTINDFKGKYTENFTLVIEDDFNTPKALAIIFDIVKKINTQQKENEKNDLLYELFNMLKCLGLDEYEKPDLDALTIQQSSDLFILAKEFKLTNISNTKKIMDELLKLRNFEREAKNFELSDKIRDDLKKIGITINDSETLTTWSIQRKL